MSLDIAFCTHCSDDWFEDGGCSKLIRTAKYFHPDIPFYVFGNYELNLLNNKYGGCLHWCNLNPVISLEVAKLHKKVIHFDADSIVLGRLDELLEFKEDVAVIRNNNDFDTASKFSDDAVTYNNSPPELYVNAGLIGSNNTSFWLEWIRQNNLYERTTLHNEQRVLNKIVQENLFSTTYLDSKDKKVHYGISSLYGENGYWESAKDIILKGEKFFLKDKQIKVWHQAGGSQYFPKLNLNQFFTKEVVQEIEFIMSKMHTYEKVLIS